MEKQSYKARAKINLALDVCRRLENGYHEVKMVMQTVDLYDELDFKKRADPDILLCVNSRDYLGDLENNLVFQAAKLMQQQYGCEPCDILAAVGPSVCRDCYEVSGDVIERFRESFAEKYWKDLFYQKENGKYQLDLWKANEIIFAEAGILPEHTAVTNVCTHCNSEVLYSHRTAGNERGSLAAFLALA